MKITKSTLKQIIKEEVVKLLIEQDEYDYDDEEELTPAQKIINLLTSNDPYTFAQGLYLYTQLKDEIETNAPKENSEILKKLEVIDQFAESSEIENVGFLSDLSKLNVTEEIDLGGCQSLENVDGPQGLDGIQGLTNLTYLDLSWCKSLQNVDGLQGLMNLTSLHLSGCESLENIDGLKECTNLTELDLSWCTKLQNIDGLEGLTNLTSLYLNRCESLQNVDGLQGLTNVKSLSLDGCTSLQNVDALKGCTNLTHLFLNGCESLPRALQRSFHSFEHIGTAYEQFIKALNASKGNQP